MVLMFRNDYQRIFCSIKIFVLLHCGLLRKVFLCHPADVRLCLFRGWLAMKWAICKSFGDAFAELLCLARLLCECGPELRWR